MSIFGDCGSPYGSMVLCEAINDDTLSDYSERIDPLALGNLAVRRQTDDALQAFANSVRTSLADLMGKTGTRIAHAHWTDNREALDLLVQRRSEELVEWLAPIFEDGQKSFRIFIEDYPIVGLCRALLENRPADGARLWLTLFKGYDEGIVRSEEFETLPIAAPDHPEIDAIRASVLDWAKTDLDLWKIAHAAIEHDRQAWMLHSIQRDLDGTSAGVVARGVTLAGFLDFTPEAEALWHERLADPPAAGWLSKVHGWASRRYRLNKWAHHWFDLFLAERDRDRAFGFYLLFSDCADRRALVWAGRQIALIFDDLPETWRIHWSFCWPTLVKQVKKHDNQRKKNLFGTSIFVQSQAPWL